MAAPGVVSEYIVKNYKRLLICVAPPVKDDSDDENDKSLDAPQVMTTSEREPVSAPLPPSNTKDDIQSVAMPSKRVHASSTSSQLVDVSAAAIHIGDTNHNTNEHVPDAEPASRWSRRRSSVRARLSLPRLHRPPPHTQAPSIDPRLVRGT